MFAPILLLFVALCAPSSAFVDRSARQLFQLPELRAGHARALVLSHEGSLGSGHKHLVKDAATGAYPEVIDSHKFLGETELGFVDLE
jgi:hypothetical protein